MPSQPSLSAARGAPLSLAAVIATLLVAACGAASPSGSPTLTASPTQTAASTSAAAGPTDFAAWTARQGFGGSSGLNEVNKFVVWLGDNPGEVTIGLVDVEAIPVVDSLATWLDEHPPTSCWAAYRDAARADLTTIRDGYATIRAALAAGKAMPTDVQVQMEQAGRQALDRPAPADCP